MRSADRLGLAVLVAVILAFVSLRFSPVDGPAYVLFSALAGATAGWFVPRHSVLAGVAAIVLASIVLTAFVLASSFLRGDFGRTFPDCDPCGFNGYLARMLIVSAMLVSAFGPLAGFCGWLGSVARSRLRPV